MWEEQDDKCACAMHELSVFEECHEVQHIGRWCKLGKSRDREATDGPAYNKHEYVMTRMAADTFKKKIFNFHREFPSRR